MYRFLALPLILLACLPFCSLSAQTPLASFDAHIRAAQTAARGGLPLIAAREYRAALTLHPSDVDTLYALGGVLEQAGQKSEAIRRYQEVISLHPDFAPAHNALAGLLEDEGQTAAALAQYYQALALEPTNARLHFNLAAALEDAGQRREAEAEYRESLHLQPDFAEAQAALRENLAETTAKPPARTAASLRDDGNCRMLLRRGLTLEATGHETEAAAAFRAVLAMQPRNASAHLHLGIDLYADGQTATARREWETVLALHDPSVWAQAKRLLTTYP